MTQEPNQPNQVIQSPPTKEKKSRGVPPTSSTEQSNDETDQIKILVNALLKQDERIKTLEEGQMAIVKAVQSSMQAPAADQGVAGGQPNALAQAFSVLRQLDVIGGGEPKTDPLRDLAMESLKESLELSKVIKVGMVRRLAKEFGADLAPSG